ncbi:hypothetical protein J7M22_11395 [Candidatus Poribacteria bacterium]|nr:hypothetical protein [Candidatus Poribacteria bacterium]
MIVMLCVFLIAAPVNLSPSKVDDLEVVLGGVKYHDRLIHSCHVSFTCRVFFQDKMRKREGECFISDKMMAVTEITPPEPIEGESGKFTPKIIRKCVFDGERFMDLYLYQPVNSPLKPFKEVSFHPREEVAYLFLYDYPPQFWNKIARMHLDELVKHPSVSSVIPKGFETVNGDLCYRIFIEKAGTGIDILVNLDRGYRIQEVRYTESKGQRITIRKVEWKHYRDQIWYPVKVYTETYGINDDTKEKIIYFWKQIEYKDFEANIEIPEDVFLTIPPPDAELIK